MNKEKEQLTQQAIFNNVSLLKLETDHGDPKGIDRKPAEI